MAQIIENLDEDILPPDTGISVVFYDDEIDVPPVKETTASEDSNVFQLSTANETPPLPRQHPHSLRRMIFNPLHPSSELPPENLIELRKVHAGLAQRRKKKPKVETVAPLPITLFEEPFEEEETSQWGKILFAICVVTGIAFTLVMQTNEAPGMTSQQSFTASGIPVFEPAGSTEGQINDLQEPESGIYRQEHPGDINNALFTDG